MSLRWRIAAGLGVIAALACTFGAVAAYISTSQRLHDSIDTSMLASANALSRSDPGAVGGHSAPQPTGTAATTATTAASDPSTRSEPVKGEGDFQRPEGCPPSGMFQPAVAAQRISADGTVTACIEGGPKLPVGAADEAFARDGGETRIETVTIKGDDYRVVTVAARDGGAYQFARALDEVDGVLASLRTRLVVIGLVGVGAAMLLGWLVARRMVRPVEQLRDTAEQIAVTQDLSTPIPVGGAAEIGSLARSFTTMVVALGESRREQQQLISDASHELRTPLTSLQTNAELLARADELDPGEYQAVVEGLQLEVGELTDLVSELVELATDRSADREAPEVVSLAELARSVAARAERRSGRAVAVVDEGSDSSVFAEPQLLERAISNLVENAQKYSPADTGVEVAVRGRRLEVRDRGRGIPERDLPHVFDRFYRSVEARTEPGSGLGLAIVKQTVERHHGTVWATTRPTGGAAVGFELPPVPDGVVES
jgi:two-component system sensor histidine kinase MprB